MARTNAEMSFMGQPPRITSMSESGSVQQDEERNADGAVEHERRFAPAPLFRLPAREPLAADHHEAAEPECEAEAQPGERHALRGMELTGAGAVQRNEDRSTDQAQHRGAGLGGDDEPEGDAVRERRGDGAV